MPLADEACSIEGGLVGEELREDSRPPASQSGNENRKEYVRLKGGVKQETLRVE